MSPLVQNWLGQQSRLRYKTDESGRSRLFEGEGNDSPIRPAEGQSVEQYIQQMYDQTHAPGWGTEGTNYEALRVSGGGVSGINQPVSFFSGGGDPQPTMVNGKPYVRVGEDLSRSMQDPRMAEAINKFGGPGIAINDPAKGWLIPSALAPYLGQINAAKQASWVDMLPVLFGAAVTGGVGAIGAGAAAGAGGTGAFEGATAGAAGGYGGLSEAAIGQLARQGVSAAGSQMTGGGSPWGSVAGAATTVSGNPFDFSDVGGSEVVNANPLDTGGTMDDYFVDNWDMMQDPTVMYQDPMYTGGFDWTGATADASGGFGMGGMDWSKILGLGARLAPGIGALGLAGGLGGGGLGGGLDTAGLTSLAPSLAGLDRPLDPTGTLGTYDIQTGQGRDRLNSSLTNRGVMGSSFGNMDIGNYDTTRDIGRANLAGGLDLQGRQLGLNVFNARRGLANDTLQAQLQQRAIQMGLYGRAFDTLGRGLSSPYPNIFGGTTA